eukprot:scaffold44811_cov60-Phaeocystis_antarctica.AAC.1
MATWLAALLARLRNASAACSCAIALPPRTSATRGSMAPARTMATRLSALSKARLTNTAAAATCAPALSPPTSATRGSMAPARTIARFLSAVSAAVASAQAAGAFASSLPLRTSATRVSMSPAARALKSNCGVRSGRPRAAVLCAPKEPMPPKALRCRLRRERALQIRTRATVAVAVRTSIVWTARPTGLEHAGAFNAVLGALRANGAELAKLLNFGKWIRSGLVRNWCRTGARAKPTPRQLSTSRRLCYPTSRPTFTQYPLSTRRRRRGLRAQGPAVAPEARTGPPARAARRWRTPPPGRATPWLRGCRRAPS